MSPGRSDVLNYKVNIDPPPLITELEQIIQSAET